mmetsp:Transcript_43503/g.48740  ORF Transcript_43503/g.48740 Transcript_43503/m.48740 type:complete len:92 (+) Transcript_43503:51-326(+)
MSGIKTMIMVVIVIRLDRIESNSSYYRGYDGGDNGRISSGGSNYDYGCRCGCFYRCCDRNCAIAIAMAMAMAYCNHYHYHNHNTMLITKTS